MSSKIKVVLFQPLATKYGGFRAPLNLLQIATPLLDSGFEVKVIDEHICNWEFHDIDDAKIIGVSSFTGLQTSTAFYITRLISKNIKRKDKVIVWGGYSPSLWGDYLIKDGDIDYIVTGAAEETFKDLVIQINDGNKPNNKIIESKSIKDYYPAMHLVSSEKYVTKTILASRVANVNTSYGCIHDCSFCAVKCVFNKWHGKHPMQVIDEIDYLVKNWHINGLEFSDNAPWIDKERMIKIAKLMIKRDYDLPWMSMARADELNSLNDDEWKILQRSRFKRVFVGIESGCHDVLTGICKNQTIDDYIAFAEKCSKYSIVPDYSVTFGYPSEYNENIDDTFKLIKDLKKITPSGTVMFYRFTPYVHGVKGVDLGYLPINYEEFKKYHWEDYTLTAAKHPWLNNDLIRRVNEFETVMTVAHHRQEQIFPQCGVLPQLMHIAIPIAKYRWDKDLFRSPIELKILRRLFLQFNKNRVAKKIAT